MQHRGEIGLRRIIRIAVAPNEARALVDDEFHHFRVAIRHDSGIITAAESEALRIPYTLCAAAGARLEELVGRPLTARATDLHQSLDGRLQCTHQFDLATLAVAAAARGRPRGYEMFVADPVDGRTEAVLERDDGYRMRWQIEGHGIVSAPFAGLGLGTGFTDAMSRRADADEAEAGLALRRAHFISRGRRMMAELDAIGHAPERRGCWVQQPGRGRLAKRIPHALSDGRQPILLDPEDAAWLASAGG